jgi:hypothetical protein
MVFRIGPWRYRIKIHNPEDGPLTDDTGAVVAGLHSWRTRTIWIDGQLPIDQRLDVLVHELGHAWDAHLGVPEDQEGALNRKASFTVDVQRQLEEQGGLWALGKLQPDGIAQATDGEAPNTTYAITCPQCQGSIAIGDVVSSQPRFDGPARMLAVDRRATCDFCGVSINWTEGATTAGKPNGKIMAGPLCTGASVA